MRKKGVLVGFGHRSQVGKEMAARATGFTRMAFGPNLRAKSEIINKYVSFFGLWVPDRWPPLIKHEGDGEREQILEVRRLLQERSGEFEELKGTWIYTQPTIYRATDLVSDGSSVAIEDVHFPDEANAIRDAGGILIRIDRANIPKIDHPNESALDDYDYDHVIENNGTAQQLREAVRAITGHGNC